MYNNTPMIIRFQWKSEKGVKMVRFFNKDELKTWTIFKRPLEINFFRQFLKQPNVELKQQNPQAYMILIRIL